MQQYIKIRNAGTGAVMGMSDQERRADERLDYYFARRRREVVVEWAGHTIDLGRVTKEQLYQATMRFVHSGHNFNVAAMRIVSIIEHAFIKDNTFCSKSEFIFTRLSRVAELYPEQEELAEALANA